MCRFASLVLTKDGEFWSDSDSHEDIIEKNNLRALDNAINLVRVELIPRGFEAELSCWEFIVDQDRLPDWTFRGDPGLEHRARSALVRRSEEQSWFKISEGDVAVTGYFGTSYSGDHGIAKAGDYGRVSVGNSGIASVKKSGNVYGSGHSVVSAGYGSNVKVGYDSVVKALGNVNVCLKNQGVAVVGHDSCVMTGDYCSVFASSGADITTGCFCMVRAGDRSSVVAGYGSTVTVGEYSKATVKDHGGQAVAGAYGQACVGNQGVAVVGHSGWAKSGVGGSICIQNGESIVTATVDSVNIMPNVFYCLADGVFQEVYSEK